MALASAAVVIASTGAGALFAVLISATWQQMCGVQQWRSSPHCLSIVLLFCFRITFAVALPESAQCLMPWLLIARVRAS